MANANSFWTEEQQEELSRIEVNLTERGIPEDTTHAHYAAERTMFRKVEREESRLESLR